MPVVTPEELAFVADLRNRMLAADVQGPVYEGDLPRSTPSLMERILAQPSARPGPSILNNLALMGYGGKPFFQAFNDIHHVAEAKGPMKGWDHKIDNLATTRNPIYGGKLQADIPSWRLDTPIGPVQGAVNLDYWHQQPDLPSQRQTGGERPYTQSLDALTANVLGRLPLENGWTPYAGVGGGAIRTQQGDHLGFSPPALNLGVHAFAGIEKQLTDNWLAFLEAKYLENAITPSDQQGGYRGTFHEMAGIAGLGYRFGGRK